MKKQNELIIYVVRHGQAEFNVKQMIGGIYEPNLLTAKGKEQALMLAKKFQNIKLDKIYSSDLSRARKTAEIVASKHSLTVETTKLLRERNWGSLQGKTFEEARKEYAEMFAKESKISGKEALAFKYVEDMETLAEVISRFKRFLKIVANNQPGKTILVVCHFDIMIGYLVDLGFGTYQELMSAELDHAGYYKLVSKGGVLIVRKVVGLSTKGH